MEARKAADAPKKPELKADIAFEDFEKLDIRVGTVLKCEKHPKADKLLVFELDFGYEKRTFVSGIAKFYKPEDLIGKQVCAIVNLPPRALRGIESQGMILSAATDDMSELSVVSPLGKVPNGVSVQ